MKKIIAAIAITAAFTACMPPNKGGGDMASKNKDMMQKFADEVINKHSTAMIDSLVSPDFVEHMPDPTFGANREGMKKEMASLFQAFPDISIKTITMMADSDRVTMQYTITGTNTGTMMGMPATGKKIDVTGVDIVRFNKDGKEAEHWGYMEDMKMMQQLGMMPGMGSDSTKMKDDGKKM